MPARTSARLTALGLLLAAALRRRDYLRTIARSGLFDAGHYRAQPGIGRLARTFPRLHFVAVGEGADLSPCPGFRPSDYLRANPDVAASGMAPFHHWIRWGRAEGRALTAPPLVPAGRRRIYPHVPVPAPRADVAIVLHLHYAELWPEIGALLARQAFDFDLWVTHTREGAEQEALEREIVTSFPEARIVAVPNRGRDIAPFLHLAGAGAFAGYRAVCKIHGKRSPHRIDGDRWRQALIGGILPGGAEGRQLLRRFLAHRETGVWVADGQLASGERSWGSNRARTLEILRRVEIAADPARLCFPQGSMYWIKPVIVDMLRGLGLRGEDFEPEAGQLDGTLAHAVERAIGYVAEAAGLDQVETSALPPLQPPAAEPAPPSRVTAFYLPQFHPIPENDHWWGPGFTEWRAVTAARPQLAGHAQPQLPGALGFYDLRLPETMAAQARLARAHGISAFCVYHYWFDGRRLLETPLDTLLTRPEIDFPFCLCWANEAWRRNWDGLSGEILVPQGYGPGFERALVESTLPYMRDPRYERPDGRRPRFLIYRPGDLPDPPRNIARMREAWREAGIGEVELGGILFHLPGKREALAPDLLDFWVEMPPHGLVSEAELMDPGALGAAEDFDGLIYDYVRVARRATSPARAATLPPNTIAGVMPSWDNTARRGRGAHIAWGASPASFRRWLRALRETRLASSYRRELFVNAWNEWAERAALEPSAQYGDAWLRALREELGLPAGEARPDGRPDGRHAPSPAAMPEVVLHAAK